MLRRVMERIRPMWNLEEPFVCNLEFYDLGFEFRRMDSFALSLVWAERIPSRIPRIVGRAGFLSDFGDSERWSIANLGR
jgi:hypothetical protein